MEGDSNVHPAPTSEPAKDPARWRFWKRAPKGPKRPLLVRLFGIKIWGLIKLIASCVLVGTVMLAMQFDPASPEFGARQAIAALWSGLVATARWALLNFWEPALAGAGIVLPLWVIWRLMTLPFRK